MPRCGFQILTHPSIVLENLVYPGENQLLEYEIYSADITTNEWYKNNNPGHRGKKPRQRVLYSYSKVKNLPIEILYLINTMFWLDTLKVIIKAYSECLLPYCQNTILLTIECESMCFETCNYQRLHLHYRLNQDYENSNCVSIYIFLCHNSSLRVITKLPNSEQFYKGKVKTHKYINRQNQSTTGKLWKP
jgi:hypothetical protein